MSESIFEFARNIQSEITTDKKAVIKDILNPEEHPKKSLFQNHRIKARISRIKSNSKILFKHYKDKSGSLKSAEKEIRAKNTLNAFYSKLNKIISQKKSFHVLDEKRKIISKDDINLNIDFSGEEFYGKFVEMNSLYENFLNIKGMPSMYLNGIRKIDYKLYLEIFDHFHNINQSAKKSVHYSNYCQAVLDYLVEFYRKKHPMHPVDMILNEIKTDFLEKWREKKVFGWQKEWPIEVLRKYPPKSSLSLAEKKKFYSKIDKNKQKNIEYSSKNDKNGEKNAKFENFCKFCGKNFKKTVWDYHVKGKKHLKNVKNFNEKKEKNEKNQKENKTKNGEKIDEKGEKSNENDLNLTNHSIQKTAYLEYAIKVFKSLLEEVFEETCYHIEKKLTRSFAELRKELAEREREEEEDVEDDIDLTDKSLWNGGVYNPKKIPLGWDGRPIPYWLYKFHGLNIGYKCEICGGTKYYGPRAFQQHFKEWKHANGMKALGIPNTKHFHNVTKIAEAESLFEKLKEKKTQELFNPQNEEEFEDQEGNVYGKRTYDALKRQKVI